jgi:hypothetical protein
MTDEFTRRALFRGAASLAVLAAAAPSDAREPLSSERGLWERYCEALRGLGALLDAIGGDALDRIEGVRCLSRLAALGLDQWVEHADPERPTFFELQTPVRKYLGDNPDQSYRAARIDGRLGYRVRGTLQGAAGVEVSVYAGSFERQSGPRKLIAALDETQLAAAPNGSYELELSAEPRPGVWVRLEPDAHSLLIRTYFWDRALRLAHPAPIIERSGSTRPQPLSAGSLERGLLGSIAFVDGSLHFWRGWLERVSRLEPNKFFPMPDAGDLQTPRAVRYLEARVQLAPSEALLLEGTPQAEPDYWNLVLQNRWGETPDWRAHAVCLNNRELRREPDGRVRVTVAARGNGALNWLDTAGHSELLLALRWRGDTPLPEFKTRVVPIAPA